jgi:hypothetical protein
LHAVCGLRQGLGEAITMQCEADARRQWVTKCSAAVGKLGANYTGPAIKPSGALGLFPPDLLGHSEIGLSADRVGSAATWLRASHQHGGLTHAPRRPVEVRSALNTLGSAYAGPLQDTSAADIAFTPGLQARRAVDTVVFTPEPLQPRAATSARSDHASMPGPRASEIPSGPCAFASLQQCFEAHKPGKPKFFLGDIDDDPESTCSGNPSQEPRQSDGGSEISFCLSDSMHED